MSKKNPIGHLEWRTRDAARLQRFYGSVFNWKFDEVMPGAYTMVDTGNKEFAGGIWQMNGSEPVQAGVSNYVTVDDLGDSESKLQAAGGRVLRSKQEIPGRGWFTVFTDPDENVFCLWQDMPKRLRKAEKKAQKAARKAEKEARKEAAAMASDKKKDKPAKPDKSAKKKNKKKKKKSVEAQPQA